MTQTVQELFGENAAITDGFLQIKLSDYAQYGLDGTKPSSILYSIVKRANTLLSGDTITDPTQGVSASILQRGETFYTRGNETQVGEDLGLTFYRAYARNSDPDTIL